MPSCFSLSLRQNKGSSRSPYGQEDGYSAHNTRPTRAKSGKINQSSNNKKPIACVSMRQHFGIKIEAHEMQKSPRKSPTASFKRSDPERVIAADQDIHNEKTESRPKQKQKLLPEAVEKLARKLVATNPFHDKDFLDDEINEISRNFSFEATNYISLGPKYLEEQAENVHAKAGPNNSHIDTAISKTFSSICITDPKLTGNPIKLRSKNFALGPSGLEIGDCKFLNVPHGYASGCSIYTENDHLGFSRYILLLWDPLLCVISGNRKATLASQVDITEAVRDLALEEARQGHIRRAKDQRFGARKAHKKWSVQDWFKVADKEATVKRQKRLIDGHRAAVPTNSPSPQMQRLLSLIHGIVVSHSFYVVFMPNRPGNDLSQNTLWTLKLVSPTIYVPDAPPTIDHTPKDMQKELARKLQEHLPFKSELLFGEGGERKMMHGVPVSDGSRKEERRLSWCVCFLDNVDAEKSGGGN